MVLGRKISLSRLKGVGIFCDKFRPCSGRVSGQGVVRCQTRRRELLPPTPPTPTPTHKAVDDDDGLTETCCISCRPEVISARSSIDSNRWQGQEKFVRNRDADVVDVDVVVVVAP